MVLFLCKARQRERSILQLKNHYKVVVATLSKKNEMGAPPKK